MRAIVVALLVAAAAPAVAPTDTDRALALRACDAFLGDPHFACVAAHTTVRTCDPCDVPLPRLTVRRRAARPARAAAAGFEVVVVNATSQPIAFTGFDGRLPMFGIQRRRDGAWVAASPGVCGNALDGTTTGRIAAGKRATFPLPMQDTGSTYRVGLDFWFPNGDRYIVWSAR